MKFKAIIIGKVFEKGTPTEGHYNTFTKQMETHFPVHMKMGDSGCNTFTLRGLAGQMIYDKLEEGKTYLFTGTVNPQATYEGGRFVLDGLATDRAFMNEEDINFVSLNELSVINQSVIDKKKSDASKQN